MQRRAEMAAILSLLLLLLLLSLLQFPTSSLSAPVPPYWAGGPCRTALASACQEEVTNTGCSVCASHHQSQLWAAGCTRDVVSGWCATAGTAQTCFDDGACVSLARVTSTPAQRAALNATCLDSSPSRFNWAPPSVLCDWASGSGVDWLLYLTSEPGNEGFLAIPGLATTFWADLEAMFMQSSWYMDAEKGIPGNLSTGKRLPANHRLPMVLVSSALNRMRDLDETFSSILFNMTSNGAPTAVNHPADVAIAPEGSMILFSGVDGQTGGRDHPGLKYCHVGATMAVDYTNYDYSSFTLRLEHAMVYAGSNGTMMVTEQDTAGNQPFSGEWEFISSPMTTFRQLACDIYDPPIRVGHGGTLGAVSFSYETTSRGRESSQVETRILAGLRASFANASRPDTVTAW